MNAQSSRFNVRPSGFAMIGLFALTAAVGGSRSDAMAQAVIRYGVDTERNINALAQVIAQREGFFAREGVTLEPVRFLLTGDRPTDRNAMMNSRDKFDMTRVQTTLLIEEGMKGSNLVAIAGVVNNPAYFLVERPEIKSFALAAGDEAAHASR